jgi:hypothetical protein
MFATRPGWPACKKHEPGTPTATGPPPITVTRFQVYGSITGAS